MRQIENAPGVRAVFPRRSMPSEENAPGKRLTLREIFSKIINLNKFQRDPAEKGNAGCERKERAVKMKERFRDLKLTLTPLFHCLLLVLAAFVLGIAPLAALVLNLKRLRWLWLPLFAAYWLFLSMVGRQLARRREMIQERFLYGDELFFQLYPHFRRMEELKKRCRAWWDHLLPHRRKGD